MENKEQKHPREKAHKFEANKKYFTLSIYAISVIFIAFVMFKVIMEWDSTVAFVKNVISILSPFLIGGFIAFMLSPMNLFFREKFFTKKCKIKSEKLCNILAVIVTYIIFIGTLTVLAIFIVPQIVDSVSELASKIPQWYIMMEEYLTNFAKEHPELDFIDFNMIIKTLKEQNIIDQIITKVTNFIPNIISFLLTTSITLVNVVFDLIIAVITSIYILSDKNTLKNNFRKLLYAVLPRRTTIFVVDVLKETHKIFNAFLLGKAIDSIIIGLICFMAMTLLQLDFPILISVIVGITNMIPYFGPYIGGIIGSLILLIVSPVKVIIFAVWILILQQFDGLYLGPKILGDSIGIKPIWIIFSVTVGGSLFGVLGMFLGVPVVCVIAYILKRFIEFRLEAKQLTFDENNTDLSHHIKIKKEVEKEEA